MPKPVASAHVRLPPSPNTVSPLKDECPLPSGWKKMGELTKEDLGKPLSLEETLQIKRDSMREKWSASRKRQGTRQFREVHPTRPDQN